MFHRIRLTLGFLPKRSAFYYLSKLIFAISKKCLVLNVQINSDSKITSSEYSSLEQFSKIGSIQIYTFDIFAKDISTEIKYIIYLNLNKTGKRY